MDSNREALGIVETRGLLALVEAVDAALKAANVALSGHTLVGGGLAACLLSGDVGAMRAALAAAQGAISRLAAQGATHLIPRPADPVRPAFESGTGGKGPAPEKPAQDDAEATVAARDAQAPDRGGAKTASRNTDGAKPAKKVRIKAEKK
ncbi:MAG: BMC domain-containing protein [Desulfovibrio sp.]|nr:BMC domain-containing protein [Desulfovibrio sp.]